MERMLLLDMMSQLHLYGMRSSYDEIMVMALNAKDCRGIAAMWCSLAVPAPEKHIWPLRFLET